MPNTITATESIRAARLLRNCPMEKMPLVIEVLKQGGFDITDESLAEAKQLAMKAETADLLKSRSVSDKSKWLWTDNEFVLTLREAYDDGVSFPEICSRTGLNKSTVYRCLRGEKIGSQRTQELITSAIEAIRRDNDL